MIEGLCRLTPIFLLRPSHAGKSARPVQQSTAEGFVDARYAKRLRAARFFEVRAIGRGRHHGHRPAHRRGRGAGRKNDRACDRQTSGTQFRQDRSLATHLGHGGARPWSSSSPAPTASSCSRSTSAWPWSGTPMTAAFVISTPRGFTAKASRSWGADCRGCVRTYTWPRNATSASPARWRKSVEILLAQLGTDYVDAVQIHSPVIERVGFEGAMKVHAELVKLRDEKMLRFYRPHHARRFRGRLEMIGTGGFDQVLLAYGYFRRGMDTDPLEHQGRIS